MVVYILGTVINKFKAYKSSNGQSNIMMWNTDTILVTDLRAQGPIYPLIGFLYPLGHML